MLADFQQALADVSASAEWCSTLRLEHDRILKFYNLTPRELRQFLAVLRHPGMECQCSLYRMNRLSPLMLNLPGTVASMGEQMMPVILAYWAAHPWPFSHGYVECERFCAWLRHAWPELMSGAASPAILREEELALNAAISAIRMDGTPNGSPRSGPLPLPESRV
jgi:hypothetical protein